MTIFEEIKKNFEEKKVTLPDGMGEYQVINEKGDAIFRSKNDPNLVAAKITDDPKHGASLKSIGVIIENLPEADLKKFLSGQEEQNPFLPQLEEDQERDQIDHRNPFLIPIDLVDTDSEEN